MEFKDLSGKLSDAVDAVKKAKDVVDKAEAAFHKAEEAHVGAIAAFKSVKADVDNTIMELLPHVSPSTVSHPTK